jgi:MbtH protein
MSQDEDVDAFDYKVVRNHEDQYSIWFADETPPDGWTVVPIDETWRAAYLAEHPAQPGSGNKAECLAFIAHVWTDMRPRSLREAMEGASRGTA